MYMYIYMDMTLFTAFIVFFTPTKQASSSVKGINCTTLFHMPCIYIYKHLHDSYSTIVYS